VKVNIKNIIPNIAGAKIRAIVNDIPALIENDSFQATVDSNQ
jgi:hypothetical protein